MSAELKYKMWTGNLDEIMHECSVWLTAIISEYGDAPILDVVVGETDGQWIITVYYRM